MSLDQTDPRELARLLVRRQAGADGADPSPTQAAAACEVACREIARWVGPLGADALFSRAMASSRFRHPALATIELDRSRFALKGVDESVRIHGEVQTSADLEAMLGILIGLLGRLVGADLAERLVTSPPDITESA